MVKKRVIDTEKIVKDCDTRFSIDDGSYNKPTYKAKMGGVPVVHDGSSCKDFDNGFDICVKHNKQYDEDTNFRNTYHTQLRKFD